MNLELNMKSKVWKEISSTSSKAIFLPPSLSHTHSRTSTHTHTYTNTHALTHKHTTIFHYDEQLSKSPLSPPLLLTWSHLFTGQAAIRKTTNSIIQRDVVVVVIAVVLKEEVTIWILIYSFVTRAAFRMKSNRIDNLQLLRQIIKPTHIFFENNWKMIFSIGKSKLKNVSFNLVLYLFDFPFLLTSVGVCRLIIIPLQSFINEGRQNVVNPQQHYNGLTTYSTTFD